MWKNFEKKFGKKFEKPVFTPDCFYACFVKKPIFSVISINSVIFFRRGHLKGGGGKLRLFRFPYFFFKGRLRRPKKKGVSYCDIHWFPVLPGVSRKKTETAKKWWARFEKMDRKRCFKKMLRHKAAVKIHIIIEMKYQIVHFKSWNHKQFGIHTYLFLYVKKM